MPDVGVVSGRYLIMEQVGEGGMATVYKAFDAKLERHVALKIIRTDIGQSTDTLQRFRREARALAQLTHPNIVHINDYGEQSGVPYLVMDYLPGGTLKQKLSHPMPFDEAARLLAPIARALEYAHRQNIVHRDVKPANILLTESGAPMLTDFGLAKILEANKQLTKLTATGVGLGTPDYMAPEQWFGTAEVRTDVYALGIVFYELITGRRPFSADTPAGVLIRQVNDPLPDPCQFVRNLPDRVKQVLLKALAKSVDERYRTMGEFAADLERLSTPPRPDHAEMASSLAALAAAAVLIPPTAGGAIAALRLSQSQSMVPPRTLSQTIFRTQFPAEPMPQAQAQKRGGLVPLILVTLGVMALLALCVVGGLASGNIVFGQRTPTPTAILGLDSNGVAARANPGQVAILVALGGATSAPGAAGSAAAPTRPETGAPPPGSTGTGTALPSPSGTLPAPGGTASLEPSDMQIAGASPLPTGTTPGTDTPTVTLAFTAAPTWTSSPTTVIPTATSAPPTNTSVPPTSIPPPTATSTVPPTSTSTPPPTNTPTVPPTNTPTNTATGTATPTFTPPPTNTPTASPPACQLAAGSLAVGGTTLTLPIQNNGAAAATITSIVINWPKNPASQQLRAVRFGGTQIDGSTYNNPPSNIPVGGNWTMGQPSDRQLGAGAKKNLAFTFRHYLPATGYAVTVYFDNGCSVAASR